MTREVSADGEDRINRRLRRAVLAVGIVSLLATVTAILYGRHLTEPRPYALDSYSRSALGHRAFVETLEALGVRATRFRTGLYADVQAPLWFIEPDGTSAEVAGRTHELLEIIRERRSLGRATVLVLPKWEGPGKSVSPISTGQVGKLLRAVTGDAGVARRAGTVLEPRTLLGSLGPARVEVAALQTAEIGESQLLLADDLAGVVLELPGPLLIVTDPDLVHNFNTHRADHAAVWLSIIRDRLKSDTIVVDEVFHGHGEIPSLAGALGEFPAVLLVVQALLFAIAGLWNGRARFGLPRPSPRPFQRGPSEVIDLGASVLAVAQKPHRLAAGYVDRVLEDLALKLQLERHSSLERAKELDRVAVRRGIAPRAHWLEQQVIALESGASARHALRAARTAWSFRTEILSRLDSKIKRGA